MVKNKIYNLVESAIRSHSPILEFEGYATSVDVRNAIRLVMRNNPDIFWFDHQCYFDESSFTVHLHYTFSIEKASKIQRSINDVIENDFCLEYVKNLSRSEQVVYIYKWLISYCNYNVNSAYNQSIYSVFVLRNSVCTGYAKAAHYIFKLLGIESSIVFGRLHGDHITGRHCWNIVKVEGQYYHFDACLGDRTLDDVIEKAGISNLLKIENINYNFLCVSTDEISRTRIIEDKDSLPLCETTWSVNKLKTMVGIQVKHRDSIRGAFLSDIGSSANIFLCSYDKNTVLKFFRSKEQFYIEYEFMQKLKGCPHILQYNERFRDIQNTLAIEQSTPVTDLFCSHYYELTLKGLLKMIEDIADAWSECRNRGILYRDLHLCNIYRANDGRFKLGDFGSCTTDFHKREIVGSEWFMSPETYNEGIFTESSAIYSISMIMYFILNKFLPPFWEEGNDTKALNMRIMGKKMPLPDVCRNFPNEVAQYLQSFFMETLTKPENRIQNFNDFYFKLKTLQKLLRYHNYIIHGKGMNRYFDKNDLWNDVSYKYANEIERFARTTGHNLYSQHEMLDYIDQKTSFKNPIKPTKVKQIKSEIIEKRCLTTYVSSYNTSFIPMPQKPKESFWKKIFSRNKCNEIYSSIFAPAEVRPKSHMLVQVYFHLLEESNEVRDLAWNADTNTVLQGYTPLYMKLKQGDKVDVIFKIYGENCLFNERKSLIWQNNLDKCYFDYFVPDRYDVNELSCEATIVVNGAMVGNMRFITRIVPNPATVNPEIIVHKNNRIFISYAHQDSSQIKLLALAYKAQGVDYFYDRDSLKPGDVYEEKIFDYIDSCDLFVLCWSQNAAQSEYVIKEMGRALLHAYPQLSREEATLTICPISIEPRADLPENMKKVYNFELI